MAKSLRVAYGEALQELGAKNEKVVAMDADLAGATMSSMFKEKYPDSYREHLSPCITTHDFSILRLKWVQQDESVPDYVNPADTYYIVNFYYKDWQKERDIFPSPFIGSVYIVEKTREVYKVTEKRNHKLPISGDE